MAVDAIGVIATPGTEIPRNAGISQEDFLRILLTQLRFQDPLKPADNQQFIAQLAQFSALEINRQQSEKIDSLLTIQATNQAVALMSRRVELRGMREGEFGTVTAISFATGQPLLTVTTDQAVFIDVRLSDIGRMLELESSN
jgi:flagellar basal-body rod modification protein FlgD